MTPLTTKDIPLSQAQKQWYEATCKKIDLGRLKQLIFDLTTKHSPTGAEREACEFMADYLNGVGIKAHYQPITDISGNCYGRAKGSGDGPTLMLYAPIDTLLEGDPEKDTPHAGPEHRADMLPEPYIDGDLVIGLGEKDMPAEFTEGLGGMGVACIPDLENSIKEAIYTVIDSCTRTRAEVGLKN